MTEVLKLYLLGFLISVPGVADQNEMETAKDQSEIAAVVTHEPALNNYKTCLISVKKQYSTCTTGLNKSITTQTRSAHTIFKKQRGCELKKEESLSSCKRIFLR